MFLKLTQLISVHTSNFLLYRFEETNIALNFI